MNDDTDHPQIVDRHENMPAGHLPFGELPNSKRIVALNTTRDHIRAIAMSISGTERGAYNPNPRLDRLEAAVLHLLMMHNKGR